jgi:PAS domain S-box-containing protein
MEKDNDYINLDDINLEETDLERVENEYSRFLDAFESVKGEIESLVQEENRHLLEVNEELRHEIEERKQIELRLSDQLLFREALLDAIANPISFFDRTGHYIGVNRSFLTFGNLSNDDVLGKKREDVLQVEKKGAMQRRYHEGCQCRIEEVFIRNREGELRDVMVYSSEYLTSSHEVGGRVEVLVDVTEQKELAAKQSEQEQMLIQQSKMAAMGEMIGHIAHQWRQPLHALSGVIEEINSTFEQGRLDHEAIEGYVEHGTLLAESMSDTIDDFREFFRPKKKKACFNLAKTVAGTLVLLDATLKDSNIRVEIEGDGELTVYGFENEYSQVLLNIINNAREAIVDNHAPDPKLRISYEKEAGQAVLRVADSGGGIPDAVKEKIFDPYFTTKGERSGTGIGLYMSKTIIEKNMNGSIHAYNRNGGAVFEIRVATEKPV